MVPITFYEDDEYEDLAECIVRIEHGKKTKRIKIESPIDAIDEFPNIVEAIISLIPGKRVKKDMLKKILSGISEGLMMCMEGSSFETKIYGIRVLFIAFYEDFYEYEHDIVKEEESIVINVRDDGTISLLLNELDREALRMKPRDFLNSVLANSGTLIPYDKLIS